MSRFPEDDLQMQVAQYLDLRGWLYTHVANERKTTPQAGARLKRKGVKSGVPDILIFEPTSIGFGLAIELKAGKNKTTKSQDHWLAELRRRGWKVAVCRSLDEVIEACNVIA